MVTKNNNQIGLINMHCHLREEENVCETKIVSIFMQIVR